MDKKSKRSHKLLYTPCLSRCQPTVISDSGCPCISEVHKMKDGHAWCFVDPKRCLNNNSTVDMKTKTLKKDWIGRWYDTVDHKSTTLKPKCINQKREKYVACDPAVDNHRMEQASLALAMGVLGFKLIGVLWAKSSVSDTTALNQLKSFFDSFVLRLVTEDRLSADMGKTVSQEVAQRLRDPNTTAGQKYKFILGEMTSVLPEQETPVLDWLLDHVPEDYIGDVLRGGQLDFNDGGALYKMLTETKGSYKRFSSHHKSVAAANPHYAVNEQLADHWFHILGGLTPDGSTFIQLESSVWSGGLTVGDFLYGVLADPSYLPGIAEHSLDFLVHKITGLNVGPVGASNRVENYDPIHIYNNLPDTRQAKLVSYDNSVPSLPSLPSLNPSPVNTPNLPSTTINVPALGY